MLLEGTHHLDSRGVLTLAIPSPLLSLVIVAPAPHPPPICPGMYKVFHLNSVPGVGLKVLRCIGLPGSVTTNPSVKLELPGSELHRTSPYTIWQLKL